MASEAHGPNPEISQWLEARQKSLKIVKTTKTPSGQILDWVPIESQDPGGKIASPPPAASLPVRCEDKDHPVKAVSFELDDPAVDRGPAGTVPIVRPEISYLRRTLSLKDFGSKPGGLLVNKKRPNRKPTDPSPFGYFHDIDSQSTTLYGCDGFLSVWDPVINDPPGPGDDHSLLQTWLQNYDKPLLQSIEAGWTVDTWLNGDTQPHLFVFYTTNGYNTQGNNLGGYNRMYSGWIQYSSKIMPGARINGTSKVGGEQFDISIKYQLYEGNWWFAVQGSWIGYYPASLFNGGLGNHAEWVGFGGEVYSSLADPALTKDQMGSGRQANDGWRYAAFLRNLRNQSNTEGTMVNSHGSASTDTATGSAEDPYTIQMHMNSGSSWGSYLYVGGPTR
jgi:Neprosin